MRVLYQMPLQVNLCFKKHESREETYRLGMRGKGHFPTSQASLHDMTRWVESMGELRRSLRSRIAV